MQFQCQSIALLAESHLASDPRAESQPRISCAYPLRKRLTGVLSNVEHGLDQLLAVAAKLRDRGVVLTHNLQASGKFGQDKRAHALADLVDVDVADHVRP